MIDNFDAIFRASKANEEIWNKVALNKAPDKQLEVSGTFSSAFGEKDLRYDIVGTIHAESIKLIIDA